MDVSKYREAEKIDKTKTGLCITKELIQYNGKEFERRLIGALRKAELPIDKIDNDVFTEMLQLVYEFIDRKIKELEREFEEL